MPKISRDIDTFLNFISLSNNCIKIVSQFQSCSVVSTEWRLGKAKVYKRIPDTSYLKTLKLTIKIQLNE